MSEQVKKQIAQISSVGADVERSVKNTNNIITNNITSFKSVLKAGLRKFPVGKRKRENSLDALIKYQALIRIFTLTQHLILCNTNKPKGLSLGFILLGVI